MRYCWCVNCGYSHDYKKDKKRGVNSCLNCDYTDITQLTEDEWDLEEVKIRNQHVLGDGKIFVDKKQDNITDEQLQQWLKDIKDGKNVCI